MNKFEIIDISVFVQENPDNYTKEIPDIHMGKYLFHGFRVKDLNMHYGTHMDAPCHKDPYQKTIEEYPLERFVLPAIVIESMDKVSVKLEDVKGKGIKKGCAVLLKTENSRSGRSKILPYQGDHVFLEPEALQYIIDQGATLVGFDSPHGEEDAADICDQECPIHTMVFENDLINLESVDLQDVEEGWYTLICLPVKFAGVNAAPTRAVLLKEKAE